MVALSGEMLQAATITPSNLQSTDGRSHIGSHFPKHVPTHAHASRRLLTRGPKSCSLVTLITTLQAGGRPSALARAIGEVGRIAKTLYLLGYIDDENYRRRILTQLNRGEGRHAVARVIFHGQRGELRQRYREGQEDQLGALGLVLNAVILWNTTYIQDALEALRAVGKDVLDSDVARLSPLLSQHINFSGTYHFNLPASLSAGQHRPLRALDRPDEEM